MLTTSLEFAPGTGDVARKLAEALPPDTMMAAYRMAKQSLKTTDIVLVIGDREPVGFQGMTRADYIKLALGRNGPKQLRALPIANATAHQIMKLPVESNAFWLVIQHSVEGPVACVIGAIEYESTPAESLS